MALELDFTPTARHTDPETSHDAAAVAGVNAGTNRALALLALADAGVNGLTDFELADRVGVKQTSIGVRRKELVTAGLVERAPLFPRKNADGSPCIVWRVTAAGARRARDVRTAERFRAAIQEGT